MAANADLLRDLYTALQRRDGAAMGACYAADATFRDPVFELFGWRIGAMWRMLCDRGKDLRVEYGEIEADQSRGSASLEAWYTFTGTGRPVHNVIAASFRFKAGRIVAHEDRFSLSRWAGQALGFKGRILGWAPPVRWSIQRQARRSLERYIRSNALDGGPS